MPLDKVRGLSKQKSRGQEWNDLQEWNAGMGQGLGGGSRIGTDRAVRRFVFALMMVVSHHPGSTRGYDAGAVARLDR